MVDADRARKIPHEIGKSLRMWNDFKKELFYENRYFNRNPILKIVEFIAKKNTLVIPAGTELYRSRIFKDDPNFLIYLADAETPPIYDETNEHGLADVDPNFSDYCRRQKCNFWGYNADSSLTPNNRDFIDDGRANPRYISYLYSAFDEYTAFVEVRPFLNDHVSIAKLKTNQVLKIVDFTAVMDIKESPLHGTILHLLNLEFSKPVDKYFKDYLATQYIAEYIKSLEENYDGIMFKSSLSEHGRNLALFKSDQVEVVNSKLVEVKSIHVIGIEAAPSIGNELLSR